MFFVYFDGNNYLSIKGLKLGKTKSISNAAYWKNKKHANSWKSAVILKYPKMELKESILTLKTIEIK